MDPLPPCPRFQPVGFSPPKVWSSSQAIQGIANAKKADPTRTSFVFAVFTNENDALQMLVEESVQPPIPSSQTIVVLDNRLGWEKSVTTVNGKNCNEAGTILHVDGNQFDQMTITNTNTTTLVFSKTVCTFRFIFCLTTAWEDVAVFSESDFWALFGGRKITFTWVQD
ncbi:MAG TPA: hypothetical protein VJ761_20580 [Ktedonobacteraceae bacterium]|nr:hypothetical protein [Ktedonobacteraceae bacterium]